MRYLFSVVRFVPDPARGECVNLGVVVGSDQTNEWQFKLVENYRRARAIDEEDAFPGVLRAVNGLAGSFESVESMRNGNGAESPFSEAWLQRQWEECRNTLQFTMPTPVVADDVVQATELIFDQVIVDVESRRFTFQKKNVAQGAVRRAYRERSLYDRFNIGEHKTVAGPRHREVFDFVVVNGAVKQLAQTWSFQVPDHVALAEGIKAWAWTVHDIRAGGGEVEINGARVAVPRDVNVSAAIVPPKDDASRAVLDEARSAFVEINVGLFDYSDARQVAEAVGG